MKVRATAEYEKRNLKDVELDYIPREGEEFEVSEERYRILSGKNPFNAKFVEKVDEALNNNESTIETVKKENEVDKVLKSKASKGKNK